MSSCWSCPDNAVIDESVVTGADSQLNCTCRPTYFQPKRLAGEPCQKCPRYATCKGQLDPPIASKGYWMDRAYPAEVVSCGGKGCLGGTLDTANESLAVSRCNSGYEGVQCSSCATGFYLAIETCFPCPGGSEWTDWKNVAQTIGLILLVLGTWGAINGLVCMLFEVLDLFLNFAQTLGIVSSVDLNWSEMPELESLMSALSVLDFDV